MGKIETRQDGQKDVRAKAESNYAALDVMWRADFKKGRPVRVECPHGLYPHRDADGERIFGNTHFLTSKEAREKLWREAMAWAERLSSKITQLETELTLAKDDMVRAGRAIVRVKEQIDNAT